MLPLRNCGGGRRAKRVEEGVWGKVWEGRDERGLLYVVVAFVHSHLLRLLREEDRFEGHGEPLLGALSLLVLHVGVGRTREGLVVVVPPLDQRLHLYRVRPVQVCRGPTREPRELIFSLRARIDRVGSAPFLLKDRAGVVNRLLLAGFGLVEGGEGGAEAGRLGG